MYPAGPSACGYGNCYTNPDPSMDGLEKAPVSAIFKYSGWWWRWRPNTGLSIRTTTTKHLIRVQDVWRLITEQHTIFPDLVTTCNGSLYFQCKWRRRLQARCARCISIHLIRIPLLQKPWYGWSKEMLRVGKDAQHPKLGCICFKPWSLGALTTGVFFTASISSV